MNISYTIITIAVVATAMGIAPLIDTIQSANAEPRERHGTCDLGGHSEKGASGCAGNVGGFIKTPNGRCIEQNTPNSEFEDSC
jgi:hypothetical protein